MSNLEITFFIVSQSVGEAVTTNALLFLSAVILTSPLKRVEPSEPPEIKDLALLEAEELLDTYAFAPETKSDKVFASSSEFP